MNEIPVHGSKIGPEFDPASPSIVQTNVTHGVIVRRLGMLLRERTRDAPTELRDGRKSEDARFLPKFTHARPKRGLFTPNRLLFLFLFLIPATIGVVYYLFIESSQYHSITEMTVIDSSENATVTTVAPQMFGTTTVGAVLESNAVADFIQSRAGMMALQKKVDLRAMWDKPWLDWYSRLRKNTSNEEFFDYYQMMVTADYDLTTGAISVEAIAYTPDDARKITRAIVDLSDELVNSMMAKTRKESLDNANDLVNRTRARVVETRLAVKKFRNAHTEFDPNKMASDIGQIAQGLEAQLSTAYSTLMSVGGAVSRTSPQIASLNRQIAGLKAQLNAEKERLGNPKGGKYAALADEYGRLVIEEGFATTDYTNALALQETTRTEVALKHSYVVPFVPPSLPDTEPRWFRLEWAATSVIIAFIAFGIIALTAAAIREHARN